RGPEHDRVGLEVNAGNAFGLDPNQLRIRTRGDDEVVFESGTGAAEDGVDTWPNVAVSDLFIGPDAGAPFPAAITKNIVRSWPVILDTFGLDLSLATHPGPANR